MDDRPLKIDFKRSGGIAGMTLSTCVEVDDLPDAEQQSVRDMVERVDLEEVSKQGGAGAGSPDRFVYELRIEHGEETVDVRMGESELPDDLRPLVKDLESRAKQRR